MKRVEAFSAYKALEQAVADSGGAGTPVVFHRSNARQWIVVLSADAFLDLVNAAASTPQQERDAG